MVLEPGQILGDRFDVLEVHPGGMGIVFIVRDRDTGEKFAAKTVRDEMRENPRVLARFQREVRTWIGLGRHPNLVAALFVEEFGGLPYLFLEYVDGPTLAALLARDGPLCLPQALDLAIQYGEGLAWAHEKPVGGGNFGIVHRDVKPENLFVDRARTGKVSDLGIAKLLAVDLEATAEGIGMGTPYYVSPEQLKGARDVDVRADVYSFGAVLFEMVTGRIPLRADSLESQIYMILRARPEAPSRANPRVPAALDDLVRRCLEKEPAARPSGLRAVVRELREIAGRDRPAEIDPPRRTCTACGYASSREPEVCPVCGGETGPMRAFVPRAAPAGPRALEARPAELVVVGVDAQPRPVAVGGRLRVAVSLANRGTVTARRVELAYPIPDADVFRIDRDEASWRGEVPPTGSGLPLQIRYELVPLREGTWVLPPAEVRWRSGGEGRVARGTEETKIPVTLNYDLPLAGRARPWTSVTGFLSRKSPGFVLVESEVGGGRSRFLAETAGWLAGEGWTVIRGKALERGREPMKVFHDLARGVFGIGAGALTASSLMARVIDRLAPLVGEDPVMAGYFAAFLRGGETAENQGGIRSYLWYRLLGSLARERPLALVIDDFQWADEESIDLAESLVRRAGEDHVPLVVVGASLSTDPDERTRRRIAALKDRFAALATNPGLTHRVVLERLRAEEVHALLDAVFPGNTLTEDHPWLLPTLVSQSGGNPFHLVQILKLLREAKDEKGEPLVSAEGGAWTLRPALTEDRLRDWIPEAVEDLVRTLVRPLPDAVRAVLETAAAIGEEFEVGLLSAVTGPGAALESSLQALEQADLVRSVEDGGDRLRFTNSLVPSIVEGFVRERSRRAHARIHRDLARALETTLSARDLRKSAMRYARHLLLGGEREKAFPWLVVAAEGYVRQQLFLRADSALSRAGHLLEEGVTAPRGVLGHYYFLRGEVSRITGNLSEALTALNQATGHLSGPRARSLLARALGKMGKIHEVRGEIDRALQCYELGAQIRADIGETFEIARSLNNLGSVHMLRGEEEKAREAFEQARARAEESGNRQALGAALDNLADLEVRRGHWERAEDLFRESLGLAEKILDRLGMARSLNGLGGLCFRRGDMEGALRFYERAIEIRREVGDREGVANLLSNLGVIHDRQGDTEEALRFYRRAAEAHGAIGSRRGLATVLNNIGVVNHARGDVNIAIDRFEEALRIRRELGDRSRIGLALQNLGEALAGAGRAAEAQAALDEALEAATASEDPQLVASVYGVRGAVRRRAGDLTGAARELAAGLEREGREPRVRAVLHLEMAEVLLALGDRAGAEMAARRGLEHAEKSGGRAERAQGRRLLGLVLFEAGNAEGALAELRAAEESLGGTSGPDLLRLRLAEARVLRERDPARARSLLLRARGLLDALEARGAVLPERRDFDRWIAAVDEGG